MTDTIKYVSPAEFADTVQLLEERRKMVAKIERIKAAWPARRARQYIPESLAERLARIKPYQDRILAIDAALYPQDCAE